MQEIPESFFHRARRFAGIHSRMRPAVAFAVKCTLAFALACSFAWVLEQRLDSEVEENEQGSILTQPIFGIATFYHHLVTAGPRKPTPTFTVLIEISHHTTPPDVALTNVCTERRYLGELLKGLALAHPNVVVLDKFFGRGCPDDDPGTRNLVAGVTRLCEDKATVVVGRAIDEDARERGFPIPFPLDDALDFRAAGAGCVNEGIVNLDPDLRRVSLWFPEAQAVAYTSRPSKSLTLAAALARKPDLKVAGWTPTSDPPYVSFLERGQFDSVTLPANDLICGSLDAWRACGESELREKVRALARGKVVVIGKISRASISIVPL